MADLLSQLGLAGAIISATIVLLREIRKNAVPPPLPLPPPVPHMPGSKPTVKPPSANGRVQRLEDRTDARFERIENKIQAQTVQLDCMTKEQFQTRSLVERQGGKLDAILEVLRHNKE